MKKCVLVLLLAMAGAGWGEKPRPMLTELDEDYPTLQSRFLSLADEMRVRNPGVEVESYSVEPGLQIDSVYIPPSDPSANLIILTSGVHGVEAPAGSFIERDFLSACGIEHLNAAVLVIHTVNPYGFNNLRRVNEDNVDLNRNCYDYRAQPFPGSSIHNDYYQKYQDFLESPTSFWSIAKNIFHVSEITKALSGQYQSPEGIYYGGDHVEPECAYVEQLIDRHLGNADHVLYFDLHTGYGKRGISQIMADPPPKDTDGTAAYNREMQTLNALFPEDECKGICAVNPPETDQLVTTGDLTGWLVDSHPALRRSGLLLSETVEVGTESGILVLPGIINENDCVWHRERCDDEQLLEAKENLQSLFIPRDQDWRDQLAKGSEQICRAIRRFSN